MMNEKTSFAEKHAGLWQAVKFALLGLIASAAEFLSFSLFRFWLFAGLGGEIHFWIFDYGPESGGRGYFLSVCLSYAIGQCVNFAVQRKFTFKSGGSAAKSFAMYVPMALLVWLLQLWLPTAIRPAIVGVLGATAGDLAVKLLCMFAGLLIAFPLSKFVIFKEPDSKEKAS